MGNSIIWLASYPRSGNTFLRTILWHCFGQRSGSVYPQDLGGNTELELYIGHIEHGENGQLHFPAGNIPFVKTHEHDRDDKPAIYVVRDGIASCVSMWQFYKRSMSLEAVMTGHHRFGTWTDHVQSWHPWDRQNTLLLRYEEMISDLPSVLQAITSFLGCKIKNDSIPNRNTIAGVDGRWVRKKATRESILYDDLLEKYNQINRHMLEKCGYLPDKQ